MSVKSRFRIYAVAAVAFGVGVFFASGLDLTRWSWAQPGSRTMIPASNTLANVSEVPGSFADIAERVTPAVVSVRTTRRARARTQIRGQIPQGMEDLLDQLGVPQQRGQAPRQEGEGSGFIIRPDGYIITNNHVVADADQVMVVLSDKRSIRAKIVGTDSTTDVAVLKIDGSDYPTIPLGDDETARIGDWVIAVGNPLGLDFTVTAGIVSAKGRGEEIRLPNSSRLSISDFIQTDAAINPGNSGGPLINMRGEVIGLNSAIASATGYYSGYGFAIPVTLVREVAEDLIRDGRVRLPALGVLVGAVTPDDAGVNGMSSITGVKVGGFNPPNGSPAQVAGLEIGDIIIAIGDKPVERVSSLQRIVRTHSVGETVKIDVLRFGAKKSFKVKLTEAETILASNDDANPVRQPRPAREANPEPTRESKLGVTVAPITTDVARQLQLEGVKGVRVVDVSDDGPAYGKLVPNDVIVEVLYPQPRRPVTGTDELQKALSGLRDGDYVSFMVKNRQTDDRVVNLRIGE